LADLPDPESGEFYQTWIQRGSEGDEDYSLVSVGKMTLAKGGWMLSYRSGSDYSDYSQVIISLEKTFDDSLENVVLEGNY